MTSVAIKEIDSVSDSRGSAPAQEAYAPSNQVQEQTPRPAPQSHGGDSITLRRSGKQPMRFRGTLLAEATGHSPVGSQWHEINIYRRDKGTLSYVVDLRVFKKKPGEKDLFYAESFSSLGEVFEYLENYDPRADIPILIETESNSVPTAQLTLQAVALRQRMDEVQRDYGALIGDLLFQLEESLAR